MVYYGDNVNRDKKKSIAFFNYDSFVSIAKRIRIAGCLNRLQIGCVIEDDKIRHFSSFQYFLFIYVL